MAGAWRGARAAAGLALATLGGGCALVGDLPGLQGSDRHGAWLAYLSGDDLRNGCEGEGHDRFRVVYRQPNSTDFHVLDVVANAAGGAVLQHHAVLPVDLSGTDPDRGDWQDGGDQLAVGARQFDALIFWLDWLGMFTPAGTLAPGRSELTWLISGCVGGGWFLNVHHPPDTALDVGSSPTPHARGGRTAGGGPDRTGAFLPPSLSGRALAWALAALPRGSGRSVPAAPATDHRAASAATR